MLMLLTPKGGDYGMLVAAGSPTAIPNVTTSLPRSSDLIFRLSSLPRRVRSPASNATNSHGVTGGVYKGRERYFPRPADLAIH